jgi:hypothetical protein
MESALIQHSGVAEAGVTGDALLEGAAAGTTMSLPYCRHLASALLEAVRAAHDELLDRPQLNKLTVFAETWHAASLALLSDADIANLWRLADYLMLDAACFRCLEDVVVQREVRSGVPNQLLSMEAANKHKIIVRVADLIDCLPRYDKHVESVARGLSMPVDGADTAAAANWAHWDLLLQARAAGIQWTHRLATAAASCGHLHLLQRLRHEGCPWDEDVVRTACVRYESMRHACWRYESIAVWALENGAPTYGNWLETATRSGCQQVLLWAWDHGRLPANKIPALKWNATHIGERIGWTACWPPVMRPLSQVCHCLRGRAWQGLAELVKIKEFQRNFGLDCQGAVRIAGAPQAKIF